MKRRPLRMPVRALLKLFLQMARLFLGNLSLKIVRKYFPLLTRNREHLSQLGDDTSSKYPTPEAVSKSIETPSNPKRLRFGIWNKQEQFVESINITPDDASPGVAEIGYYLGSEFQRKGYVGRSVETLTDYGFNVLGYNTIYGDIVDGNRASVNVLIRAGYKETVRHGEKIRFSKQK